MRCGYVWWAPHIIPDGPVHSKFGPREKQVCTLEKGHRGDHRSVSKITTANAADKKES